MRKSIGTILLSLVVCSAAFADQPVAGANADPVYRQLRDISLGGDAITVSNFTLTRDAAKFKFKQGTFVFVSAVNGKVTGAVFTGDGEFIMTPPARTEARTLRLLTNSDGNEIVETFHDVVLRFTDNTFDEVKSAGTPAQGAVGAATEPLRAFQDYARKQIRYNFDARILQDVLSADPGGYFVAFIDGQKYSSHLLYTIDPHGAENVQPEEISLRTYDDGKYGIWAAFHYSDEYAKGIATGTQENGAFDIEHQDLDTVIEKNAYLRGNALATVVSRVNSLRALHFNLFAKLRVQKVTDGDGNPLPFIQEDKEHDYNYWVILAKPLGKDEKTNVRTIYEGKDAVLDEGAGNYYPVARSNWFPSSRFGRYCMYDMKFTVPKGVQVVASGNFVGQSTEGDHDISIWKTDTPEAVAGFNLGQFKKMDAKLEKGGYLVESYANVKPPDWVTNRQKTVDQYKNAGRAQSQGYHYFVFDTVGTMDTSALMKKPLAEAELAVDLYNYYYGPLPFKRVSMTQQTACNYGQSWPSVVYLPICSFFDSTVRTQLGLKDYRGYWTSVAPHEVAHQWWGHAVGFNSYRDQWMSEGFSDFSAALFLLMAVRDNKLYQKFWKDEYDLLTEKNDMGKRGIDVGPLTLGYRLDTTKTGEDVARRLIYPKGAYVLHMIRLMMTDQMGGDDAFRNFMLDFTKSFANRSASTEDFKAVLERHMLPVMDLDKNHKMDWFFNQYVYGTAFPNYKFDSSLGKDDKGVINVHFKITQSNVDEAFRMPVPIYLELADGRIIKLGAIAMVGNSTVEQTVPLNGLPQMPKRAMTNYNYDVLGAF